MRFVRVLDCLKNKDIRIHLEEDNEIKQHQYILIKNKKETLIAKVLEPPRNLPNLKNESDFTFLRAITPSEIKNFEDQQKDQYEKVKKAQSYADELKLKMRFFEAKTGWQGKMTSFFFTAPNPVDFRDLLKLMVRKFPGRVHLERVSERERAKIIGGVGPCGRVNCCQFMPFMHKKVSLDAVRDQGIMINHNSKIFGLHGKIKTCFLYELDAYKKNRKYLPHIKQEVLVGEQKGRVIGLDILNLKVKLIMPNDTIEVFSIDDIKYENKRPVPEVPELNFENYKIKSEGIGI